MVVRAVLKMCCFGQPRVRLSVEMVSKIITLFRAITSHTYFFHRRNPENLNGAEIAISYTHGGTAFRSSAFRVVSGLLFSQNGPSVVLRVDSQTNVKHITAHTAKTTASKCFQGAPTAGGIMCPQREKWDVVIGAAERAATTFDV